MALKSIVKVSHLSNLSDARFCSGMGVELLGFAAIPGGEHYMDPAVFQEIRGWLAGPQIIAELYGILSASQIHDVVANYAPDYFELTWEDYSKYGKDLTLPCIVSFSDIADARTAGRDPGIAYAIVGEKTSGADIAGAPYPALLRIGSLNHLTVALSDGRFQGYVIEGPRQTQAGITSYDELGALLEALEE